MLQNAPKGSTEKVFLAGHSWAMLQNAPKGSTEKGFLVGMSEQLLVKLTKQNSSRETFFVCHCVGEYVSLELFCS